MNYLLAILLPPVGVVAAGGGCGSVLLNVILTLFFYVPGLIHAVWIIRRMESERARLDAGV